AGATLHPIELPGTEIASAINFILSTEAAAAFDDLTRSPDIRDPSLNTWPNSFRIHRYVTAAAFIRAHRAPPLLLRHIEALTPDAAAAFDDLTRGPDIRAPSLNTWPNTSRIHRYVPAVEFIRAQRARTLLIRQFEALMADYDVFLSPRLSASLGLTNLTGHPA